MINIGKCIRPDAKVAIIPFSFKDLGNLSAKQIECAGKALKEKNKPIYLMYHNGAVIVDNSAVRTVGQVKV